MRQETRSKILGSSRWRRPSRGARLAVAGWRRAVRSLRRAIIASETGSRVLALDRERGVPGQALHRPVLLAHVLQVEHDVDAGARPAVRVPKLRTGRRRRDPLRLVEDAEEHLEMGAVHRRQERPERALEELLDLWKARVDLVAIPAV